jgi:phage baseplate assembly protein W
VLADRHADDDRVGGPDEGDRAMSEEFIGSGWAFPLRTDPTGRIALVSREQEVEESIRLILGTAIGERPMRPEFGCAIHDYVFDSADTETAARVATAVRASLLRWEPRIEVRDVLVSFDTEDSSIVYIDIRYAIGETNDPRNLVFPFYVIPAETQAT